MKNIAILIYFLVVTAIGIKLEGDEILPVCDCCEELGLPCHQAENGWESCIYGADSKVPQEVVKIAEVDEECNGTLCPNGCCPEKCWKCCPDDWCAPSLFDCP